ncbi:hypothetical protein GTY87_20390 [Streptomyces sp. SID7813]|uniref:Uncharacterized protein n=1 Tax=Streptomyces coelicolor (strain ATCC BAA-471 / A3(2) / M145) TaxID=100226 RepID=Q93J15_STRCO|nr:hypothetical protein [Streptomyces sp. SID7813]QFI43985.1 hypothetical protein FQ762_20570 [Streptomyces coelicolor A3(2)]CAC44717.1 hypothetical protein [Streptomyces coelicolor A3(2)]
MCDQLKSRVSRASIPCVHFCLAFTEACLTSEYVSHRDAIFVNCLGFRQSRHYVVNETHEGCPVIHSARWPVDKMFVGNACCVVAESKLR